MMGFAVKPDGETLKYLLDLTGSAAPWFAAFIIFCIFGMKHVPPTITAIGKIYNERHKTNLSHKRSMAKIENQMNSGKSGKSDDE